LKTIVTVILKFQYLSDEKLPQGLMPFQQQQSLVAKVIEVDHEKKRCLLSLRMFDCYHGDTDIGVELLSNYLEERKKIVDTFKSRQKKKSKSVYEIFFKYLITQMIVLSV
jgi:hypothetical protein